MKKILCTLFVCCAGLFSVSAARNSVELTDGWKTWLLNTLNTQAVHADTLQIRLPHNWDDYYGLRQLTHGNLHGDAMYVNRFMAPAINEGQRVFLRFEGIGTYAHIRLNGKDLGRHIGGRVSFTVDVTEAFLPKTENLLELRVEHPDLIADMPCVCGGCSSEWGFSEGSQPFGIYRPVVLEITDAVRVEPFGVHVWNDEKADKIWIETEIKNYSSEPQSFRLETILLDAQGKTVFSLSESLKMAAGQTRIVSQESFVENPHLWDVTDPYLYCLQTRLQNDSRQEGDEVRTSFGIRTISWPVKRQDGDGRFYLNGKPVFINGTCEYEHLMGQSHAFSHEQVAARVKQIRNAGFNAFRDAHQPHHLDYQNYWDREGVLFWTQLSAHIWYDTPEFRTNFKAQLRQWVKERRNSPSVVLWGLQNESTLPRAFAEECTEIIREMDPTARTMRAVTTCNGGVGTDWNVVQNWSGTYSGSPEKYDIELSMPSQLLNGEYGAWRTLDLHEEPAPFQQKGAYSEERFCRLMEMKINLAEKAKDSVCGQFQWIYNSHENPGRRQPDEAFRVIDRVGPFNYKGLVTPWEEPVDAYYMYRSNYVPVEKDPMVYIASHTWPDRFESARMADIEVYSNGDSVRLYNDVTGEQIGETALRKEGKFCLGTEVNAGIKGSHFSFEKVFVRYNVLRAVAYHQGKAVAEDLLVLNDLEEAPHLKNLYPSARKDLLRAKKKMHYLYRLNCGGDEYTDRYGNVWSQDNQTFSHSWAQDFPELNPYQASQRKTFDPIARVKDWPLLGHFRYGRHRLSYRFPLSDGNYRVELYFVEPWHGTGSPRMDGKGLRIFDVALNGQSMIDDLDIWSEVGHDTALKKVLNVSVTGGSLTISFPEVKAGQAVISAIAIAFDDAEMAAGTITSEVKNARLWAEMDENRIARFPTEQLPEDKNPRAKASYSAIDAQRQGAHHIEYMRSKEAVVFDAAAGKEQQISWSVQVGLAQLYALRFNYRNISDKDISVNMKLLSSDGRVLKDTDLVFPQNTRGWAPLSTTTGSYINAGHYQVILSAAEMAGLCIESLDVQ